MMKKQILTLLVSTSLYMMNAACAMENPGEEEDIGKQYLVHLSNVMAENSTKIAGAQMANHTFDESGFKQESSYIEPEGTMIRSRITLHHCLGGVVPEENHGVSFDTVVGRIKPTSHLYTDKDLCAYLDLLSEFEGELIGGELCDMSTIDRHEYKEKSIVIVPHHKVDEFRAKNPHFKGKCIEFDPEVIKIADKVDEVIHSHSKQTTFKELSNKITAELISAGRSETDREVMDRFEKNNLLFQQHETTSFRALEHLLVPLKEQIRSAREQKSRIICPADQIPSRLEMIRSLLSLIVDFTLPRLNEDKYFAVRNWQQDTLNWLNLFELDAHLRKAFKTSLFINNPQFDLFMNNRENREKLIKLSSSLSLEEAKNPKLESRGLFPELFELSLFSEPEFKKFIQVTDLSVLMNLKDRLVENGYGEYGHGLILLRLLEDLDGNESWRFEERKKQLRECLNHISPSPRLQVHVKEIIDSFLLGDGSYHNEGTLSLLNSDLGKLLQKKVWGQEKTWEYMDLLRHYEKTKILFADLKNLKNPKDEYHLDKYVEDYEIKFIEVVRQWMLKHAIKERKLESGSQEINISKPHFSLLNVMDTINTITRKLNLYRLILRFDSKALFPLIEQGCFASWADLIHRTLPLENLNDEEIKKVPAFFSRSIASLHYFITESLAGKEKDQRNYDTHVNEMLEKEKRMREFVDAPHPYPFPSHQPEFEFINMDEVAGKGSLHFIPANNFVEIMEDFPLKDMRALSCTSKAMYNWCHTPFMWHCLSQKEILINPTLSIRTIKTNFDNWQHDLAKALNFFSKGDIRLVSSGALFQYEVKKIKTEPNSAMAWYVYDKGISVRASLIRNKWKSLPKLGRIILTTHMNSIFKTAIVPFYPNQINFTNQ